MKHYLSLGAGVQSSTLALMATHGELPDGYPMPDGAIFADTKAEPQSVYRWLDWLEPQLSFPIHRVSATTVLAEEAKRIRTSKRTGRQYIREVIPLYMKMPDGSSSMLWRRCSRDYKIRPIQRALRELAGVPLRGRDGIYCTSWIGISTDEASRMKPSRESWVENRWPLIDANMTRLDCFNWMERHGYPRPPRSSCYFCPYHSNKEWQRLKDHEPEDFERAAAWEEEIQELEKVDERYLGTVYLWKGLKPLREAVFSDDIDGQQHLFDSECEGICGV
jgi:3'-phosphoadenosine 5'-phosphosulfate sulfotransferase (PAPS reductase)/FAD synthetase